MIYEFQKHENIKLNSHAKRELKVSVIGIIGSETEKDYLTESSMKWSHQESQTTPSVFVGQTILGMLRLGIKKEQINLGASAIGWSPLPRN